MVYLNGHPEKLQRLAAEQKIENIGLAYLEQRRDFRDKRQNIFDLYKINPAARNTVIVYRNWKVVANFVNLDANDFGRVEAVVRKIVPGLKLASGGRFTSDSEAEGRAAAAIGELGGKVGTEDGRVVEVELRGARITDASLEPVKYLTHLRSLTLGETAGTDAGLAHLAGLRSLRQLSVTNSPITDAGLAHLKRLSNLERLDLKGSGVAGMGLRHLRSLTRLWSLQLGGHQVTDAGLRALTGLTQLKHLRLADTPVTDAGLARLKGLPRLEWLELYHDPQITDAGLAHLGAMTQLKNLELGGLPQVTDAGLAHLTGLTHLEELILIRMGVTDTGVNRLKQALPNLQVRMRR